MANHPVLTLNGLLQQVAQSMEETKHSTDPCEDCGAELSYSLQHVLMVMIQKITGHKTHEYIHGKYVKDPKENTNYVEVSVYVPQKKIVFTEENMAKVLMEGSLLDMSDDLEEAKLKDSTPKRKKKTTTDSKSKKK